MASLIEKMSVRGSLGTFRRGGIGSYNCLGGSFANLGSIPPNGPNKTTNNVGQPRRIGATIDLKCFRCGGPSHRMADCCKGEKYGKGLLVDAGGAFEEQGDGEEHEADFDGDGDEGAEE